MGVFMDLGNKTKKLLEDQRQVVKSYEELLKEIHQDDSISENVRLKEELEVLKTELYKDKERIQELSQENISSKIALKEQMYNERNSILKVSLKKIDLYFKNEKEGALNRLFLLENSARNRIKEINNIIACELQDEQVDLDQTISALEQDLEARVQKQKNLIEESYNKSLEEIKQEYEIEKREITKEELAKKQKHNNLEISIGLNWLNKIGIILLLFGVATTMKYTYSVWFNDYLKALSGFLLGGIMLGIGEWFNRKEKNLFSLGLCGGGIGVLYLAVFSSFFYFKILHLSTSIVISILITLVALILSQRYSSKTIAGISLVGGYLPFFSLGLLMRAEGSAIYAAMGYLLILNLLILIIAFGRRWLIINYLSFILNMPCLILLVLVADKPVISIIYALLTFMMYMGITLAYPIRKNIKLKIADISLLGINTVINSSIVYILFIKANLNNYMGLLALIYAILYFTLSKLINGKSNQEDHVEALFLITSLTFTILMIPLQFGIRWASMGWLIEGILLLVFTKKGNVKKLEIGGWVILSLCTLLFIIDDINMGWDLYQFMTKYTLLSFGLIYVLTLYISEDKIGPESKLTRTNKFINIYKYAIVLNTWLYLLRVFARGYNLYLANHIPTNYVNFYKTIIIAMLSTLYAYTITKIKPIKDRGIVNISIVLMLLSNIICLILNFHSPANLGTSPTIRWLGIIILLIYNIFVFLSVKDMVISVVKRKGMSIEYYPLAMAVYLLGVTTTFISQQLHLQNINLIISIILVISAMISIIYGFRKDYLLIRRFGLGLSIFSTGKLFIFDLRNLQGYGRIIAYFSFGLVLIGISYIYQKLNSSIRENQ